MHKLEECTHLYHLGSMTSSIPVGAIKWFWSVCVWGVRKSALTLFHESEQLEVRRENGKVTCCHSQPTSGQTACVWGSEVIPAGLVIAAPSLAVCVTVFLPLSILLIWQEEVTQESMIKITSSLQRGQGKRAPQCSNTACVQCVCVFKCVFLDDNLCLCR